jgi:hypothetical protein
LTKAGPRTPDGVRASVVLREHLDILMALAAVDLVLDAEVGEVDAIVEVWEFVFSRPAANFLVWSVRSSIAVGPLAVVVLQELLILPFQVLSKHNAVDIDVLVLLPKAGDFFAIRGIQVGVVIQFSCAADACVELLGPGLVALTAIGIEHVPALFREDDRLVAFSKRDGPNQPFVTQVIQSVVVTSEITLQDNSKGSDCRQGTAVLAIQFGDPVAVDHQLARVAAGQVKAVHQAVARIVFRQVAMVIHACTPVIAFARVIPWIVHCPSRVVSRFGCA